MKKLRNKKRPMFIAVEGGEGSGKSSLMAALAKEMPGVALITREPGGSPYAEIIRNAALKNPLAKTAPAETTLCLMFAARFDNVVNVIEPSLKSGMSVVADRFDGSSFAYQVAAQTNGDLEEIFWLLRDKLVHVPDLYVFVDVDPLVGLRRARSRNESNRNTTKYDHFDNRKIIFHEKVRKGYLKFLKKVPHVTIDANRPFEEVKSDFLEEMRKLLK
ncbi:MAG: dTMP kinase [Candidatus Taylorbacteria bacterium]